MGWFTCWLPPMLATSTHMSYKWGLAEQTTGTVCIEIAVSLWDSAVVGELRMCLQGQVFAHPCAILRSACKECNYNTHLQEKAHSYCCKTDEVSPEMLLPLQGLQLHGLHVPDSSHPNYLGRPSQNRFKLHCIHACKRSQVNKMDGFGFTRKPHFSYMP